ncbi:MAG: PilZ domain-containing protein [Leptospirales bacterium]|nr:PilZ domain-containing protein [Leptospirales bacterium]
MHSERSRPRLSPTDYIDFELSIKVGTFDLVGYLGNISEDGLGAIIPGAAPLPSELIGKEVTGSMKSRRLTREFTFNGRLAWNTAGQIRNMPHLLLGVQFDQSMSLPEELIAIELSGGD